MCCRLPDGRRKRKHELVQDMLAYHKYHQAFLEANSNGNNSQRTSRHSSSGGSEAASAGVGGSTGAASPTARSTCSSPESAVWHPLGMARPGSAGPSSTTSSPARQEFVRYSHDTSGGGYGRSSGGGSKAGQLEPQLSGRAAFAVEAADADSSRQQFDAVTSTEQQQQHSPGWWSKLTPRRNKKAGSILGQLASADKSGLRQSVQQSMEGWSPEPLSGRIGAYRSTELAQQQQRSGHNSRYQSEGGCDAVSPRDKKHAAAVSRADSGSLPSSRPTTPGGISLNGRTISAVTGSAVAEFYVDSPAVKLGRTNSKTKQRSGSVDTMRLGVDLGAASALRSSWKQAQLLRPK